MEYGMEEEAEEPVGKEGETELVADTHSAWMGLHPPAWTQSGRGRGGRGPRVQVQVQVQVRDQVPVSGWSRPESRG